MIAQATPSPSPLLAGIEAYRSGDDANALKYFRQASLDEASEATAHLFVGLVHQRRGAYEDAVSALRKSLEIEPDLHDAAFPLGLALYRLKRHEEARQQFESIVARDDADANAHFFLALILQSRNDHAGAAIHFKRATGDKELESAARFNMGLAYYNLGRNDEARQEFLSVQRIEPDGELGDSAGQYLTLIASRDDEERPCSTGLTSCARMRSPRKYPISGNPICLAN